MNKLGLYYALKPLIPRKSQLFFRRFIINLKRRNISNVWPIDCHAGETPEQWRGWPGNKKFAFILTHDVETYKGLERCQKLMRLERELGFVSSFNFVPERYDVDERLRRILVNGGCEVGVHGLKHDGQLYRSKEIFKGRAAIINHYLRAWKAEGFRSPAMHHNLEWLHMLNITYDLSTFDTDPFEPQSDGVETIFPFWVSGGSNNGGYAELPYTLPQDFTLFILMRQGIDIWKKKIDWIAQHGGMALLNTHPDYMNFDSSPSASEEYPVKYYQDFLRYVKTTYKGRYWHALPVDVARNLIEYNKNNNWRSVIECDPAQTHYA